MREAEEREKARSPEIRSGYSPVRGGVRYRVRHRFRGHVTGLRYNDTHHGRGTKVLGSMNEQSFLFYNFPNYWEVPQMWRTFKRFGALVDIYIASKKLANGDKFGFVRFKGVTNAEEMKRQLMDVWIGSYRLRVHIANRNRNTRSTNGGVEKKAAKKEIPQTKRMLNTYADAVRKRIPDGHVQNKKMNPVKQQKDNGRIQAIVGAWKAGVDELEFLQKCAVGIVNKLEHFEAIQTLIKSIPLENTEAILIGGKQIMIRFNSEEMMGRIVDNKVHGIHY